MSSQNITVNLEKRETLGKGLGSLRRAGKLPAVIHRPGEDSIAVIGSYAELYKVYLEAGKHHPVNVQLGSDKVLTIIKDIHFEPRKNQIQHIVFGLIKQNEKVETEVPLEFVGDADAQKVGLLLLEQLDRVEVSAFPRDLPDNIAVSIEKLATVGDRLLVSDLQPPKGVEILTDPDQVVIAVEEPTVQTTEPEAEESATPAEPPVGDAETAS